MYSYSWPRVYFASPFVQMKVYDGFAKENHDRLMHFIRDAADNPFLSAVRGMLFEEHAHHRLCSGETFRVRSLHEPGDGSGDEGVEDSTVSFGELDTLMVSRAADVRKGHYCKPYAKNFES